MKKPYIKKYGVVAGFTVWIVDGRYIRNNIDEEFPNYGQNYQFPFIPKNEFWIDREGVHGEEKYYIDSMLVVNKLMAEGLSHEKAVEKADEIERRERAKSRLFKKELKEEREKKDIIDEIHKRLLKKYSNKKIKVWIVDGEAVRDFFFLDFNQGGNGYVYHFIPKDEIWIDDDLNRREIKFVILHELHESRLMKKGWGYAFDEFTPAVIKNAEKNKNKKRSAHFSASKIELYCRKHPETTEKKIREELRRI